VPCNKTLDNDATIVSNRVGAAFPSGARSPGD
jgi:hypothetical protein